MAKNWAIAIGINHYDNLKSLKYAKGDAEAMKAWCENEGRFEPQGLFLFTEDSPPIPTNPPIATQLTYSRLMRFLQRQFETPLLQPGDNLWFFFAGHGRRYQDKDYLMLPDSDPGNVGGTAVSVDYVTERLRRSGADNVVLLLDACRDEDSRGGLGIGEEEHKGIITFYSCAANQQSWEIDELGHGSFTHALLEGLRLQGEANCATVERLDDYLRRQVPEINATHGKPRQNPYLKAEPPYKLYFILLEQAATLRDVQPLKLQASLAENRGNLDLAEQLWIRVLGVSRGDFEAIEAIKRIAQRQLQSPAISSAIPEPVTQQTGKRSSTPAFPPESKLKKFPFEVVTVNARGQEIKKESKQAQYFSENLPNGVTLDMVDIPGGTFMMGTDDEEIERLVKKFNWDGYRREKPQHHVTVPPFYMGKYPITQAQWEAVAFLPKVKLDLNPESSRFKGDNRPVEQVSWYDAEEFCKRLSKATGRDYRLPSEAEWEYACRAGTTTPFHFGETITDKLANYNATYTYADEPQGEYREQTTPVGQIFPNAFGLYDMHGNVWEWCADDWHEDYQGAPKDGSAWLENDNRSQFTTLRGGSWSRDPDVCRSAYRNDIVRRDDLSSLIGFRVLCAFGRT